MEEKSIKPKYNRNQVVMAFNHRSKKYEPMKISMIEAKWNFSKTPYIIYCVRPVRWEQNGKYGRLYIGEDKIQNVI